MITLPEGKEIEPQSISTQPGALRARLAEFVVTRRATPPLQGARLRLHHCEDYYDCLDGRQEQQQMIGLTSFCQSGSGSRAWGECSYAEWAVQVTPCQ